MQKKNKISFMPTRCFHNLNKEIMLSKKLEISLINCKKTDVSKCNDLYMKTLTSLNINEKDLIADLSKIKLFSSSNHSISKLTKKFLGKSILNDEIEDVKKYRDYLLTKNVIVKYTEKYETITTYDFKIITRPDSLREVEVVNYINFINFMVPYNSDLEQRNYKSEDFMPMLDNVPYAFCSNFSPIEDSRKYRNYHFFNWLSKSIANVYALQDKNKIMSDIFIRKNNFNYFNKNINYMKKTANYVEKLLENEEDSSLFQYVSNTIYTAMNCNDNRTSILLYTSILEAILTHKPDANRYNVEDSINKQFCLKVCIALEKVNPQVDINRYSKICKLIYSIRSDITHGNVNNVDNVIKSFDKIYNKKEEFKNVKTTYNDIIETILNETCYIVERVLYLYLTNNDYIKFLKNN